MLSIVESNTSDTAKQTEILILFKCKEVRVENPFRVIQGWFSILYSTPVLEAKLLGQQKLVSWIDSYHDRVITRAVKIRVPE